MFLIGGYLFKVLNTDLKNSWELGSFGAACLVLCRLLPPNFCVFENFRNLIFLGNV